MRKLLWLAVFLVCAWPVKTEDGYGWAVVYKGQQCRMAPYGGVILGQSQLLPYQNYSSQTWGALVASPCSYGTEEVTITEWYPTKDLALQRVNGKLWRNGETVTTFICGGDSACWNPMGAGELIGIFKTERVELQQVEVGRHQIPVQRTDYVDMPTMEWREKK